MIHNVLMTGLTPLSNTNEIHCWDNRPFTTVWPEIYSQKSKDLTRTIKKKSKRARTAFTIEHLRALEKTYGKNKYIDTERRRELAKALNISEKCIKVWFQNRRMKEKKEASESSCDSSSEMLSSVTPTPSTMPQSDQITNQYNPNQLLCNDSYYQMPSFYLYNGNEVQSSVYDNLMPITDPNGIPFNNDRSTYPTQYYPSSGVAYDIETNQYSQYGETHDYWPAIYNSNNDPCYL